MKASWKASGNCIHTAFLTGFELNRGIRDWCDLQILLALGWPQEPGVGEERSERLGVHGWVCVTQVFDYARRRHTEACKNARACFKRGLYPCSPHWAIPHQSKPPAIKSWVVFSRLIMVNVQVTRWLSSAYVAQQATLHKTHYQEWSTYVPTKQLYSHKT